MATKIFMASAENCLNRQLDAGVRHHLFTFYHIRKGKRDILENLPNGHLALIDSGAWSIRNSMPENEITKEWCEKYIKDYFSWLLKWKHKIFAAVELDIEAVVGYDIVKKWQLETFRTLEHEGLQIIYVWHPERGAKEWENMCKKFSYVGIADAGADLKNETSRVGGGMGLARMMQVAAKHKTRVHGFGITREDIITRLPFYTVDSMTWKNGERFGELQVFRAGKLNKVSCNNKQKRVLYTGYLKKIGMSAEEVKKIIKDADGYTVTKANMKAWLMFQNAVQRRVAHKAYWLSAKEKQEIITMKEKLRDEAMVRKVSVDEPKNHVKLRNLFDDLSDKMNEANGDIAESAEETKVEISREERNRARRIVRQKIAERKKIVKGIIKRELKLVRETDRVTGKEIIRLDDYREKLRLQAPDVYEYLLRKSMMVCAHNATGGVSFAAGLTNSEVEEGDTLQSIVEREKRIEAIKTMATGGKKGMLAHSQVILRCDNCYGSGTCAEFVAGSICSLSHIFRKYKVRDMQDVTNLLKDIVETESERAMKALHFEQLDGGLPTEAATALLDSLYNKLFDILELQKESDVSPEVASSISITAKGDGLNSFDSLLKAVMGKDNAVIDADYEDA